MGWTYYHADATYNPRTHKYVVNRKAECDNLFNCEMIECRGKFEVLKSRMIGTRYYAAIKITTFATETEPEDVRVCGVVVLTSVVTKAWYNFGYKEISETMGPQYCDCPKSILDLLTPTDDEYANAWRKACYERIKRMKGE